MLATSSNRSRILLLMGVALVVGGLQGVLAQRGQGRYPQSEEENQDARQSKNQVRTQEREPFVHGLSVGAGLAIYQGDFSLNPNHNVVKYIAGSGRLSLQVGIDHRLGRFDQYGFGADLSYIYLSGQTATEQGFRANSVALDFYADYELPYIREGLFRVFVGGGPFLLISPSYFGGKPFITEPDHYQPLGTRVIGTLKVGVTILDAVRVGTRIASTDLLDGYKGGVADGVPDFVSFLNIRYRFGLK